MDGGDYLMYRQRMIGYYPSVISAIQEFQAIIDAEYPEFDAQYTAKKDVLNNAYLLTMDEARIKQWEGSLGIVPIASSTLGDRRDTIIARVRGQKKLNSALVNSIVNAFTGGTAKSWVEDGVLYVEITPPPSNKQYQFANVEQELAKKVPAHMGLKVSRNYYSWFEVKNTFATWGDVNVLDNWETIYLLVPSTISA